MNERDAYEQVMATYAAKRGRHLVGVLRLVTLYGGEEVRRRGWISREGLAMVRRDLRLADVPWPPPQDERGTAPPGDR